MQNVSPYVMFWAVAACLHRSDNVSARSNDMVPGKVKLLCFNASFLLNLLTCKMAVVFAHCHLTSAARLVSE